MKSETTPRLVPRQPREQKIIEAVHARLRSKDPGLVDIDLKTTPSWLKVIGLVAFLLRTIEKTSESRIAEMLNCRVATVLQEAQVIADKEKDRNVEIVRLLAQLRATVGGQQSSGSATVRQDPKPENATTEDVLDAVSRASNHSIRKLKSREPTFTVGAARDVIFLLLVRYVEMEPTDAAAILNRNEADVLAALRTMSDLDFHRREYLLGAAKVLAIDSNRAIALAEGS